MAFNVAAITCMGKGLQLCTEPLHGVRGLARPVDREVAKQLEEALAKAKAEGAASEHLVSLATEASRNASSEAVAKETLHHMREVIARSVGGTNAESVISTIETAISLAASFPRLKVCICGLFMHVDLY